MRLKHPIKRGIAIVAAAGIIASGAVPAFADAYGIAEYKTWYVNDSNISVVGNQVTVTGQDGQEKTETDNDIIITGSSSEHNVTLDGATVTIKDLEIDASKTGKAAISASGNVSIELDGKNTVSSGNGHAGIEKNDSDASGTLTIKDSNETKGSLTANGGNFAAGIGGGKGESTSNITISGGTITANGGANGAGIGGGFTGSGKNITIKDGANVDAKAGLTKDPDGDIGGGAGIGGGAEGDGLGIKIDGSTVKGTGTTGGSGIGGGVYGAGDVTITGGSHVEGTATAEGGAGIGGDGYDEATDTGKNSTVKIDNSTVIGKGSCDSAGIGGGNMGGADVTITGKDSDVTGSSDSGAGIGGSGTVTIEDGKVTGNGGSGSAGIGGSPAQKTEVTIKGGTVTGNGGAYGAGIGSGATGSSDVKIKGGNVTGNGGNYGAGIGGGYKNGKSDVTLSGGTVTANGGYGAAGIGSGYKGGTGSVGIHGGDVTANAGLGGAGIGRGNQSGSTTVTIDAAQADTTVTATVKNQPKGAIGSWGTDDGSITAGALGEAHKAILKFMNDSGLYKTVHNAAYVGTGEAHAWDGGTVTKEATCTEDGTMLYTCMIDQCGETMEAAIPATGHKWSEWTVTTPATEAEEGVETRTCSNCDETETRAIPRLESADSEEVSGLHVLDKENADRSFGAERQGDTLTVTSEYEQMTTLTGTGKAVHALAEQGVKTLVFVTPHGSARVDAAALEKLLGEDGVFRLVVTEESMNLWVNDALHNELLK